MQTLQISALYIPKIANERISVSITEKNKKKMKPLIGNIQLTKVVAQKIIE